MGSLNRIGMSWFDFTIDPNTGEWSFNATDDRVGYYFIRYYLLKDGNTLLSTKGNSGFRGYGVKSIQYTVKKYDGVVSIDTKDNWFELKILVPMPMQAQTIVQKPISSVERGIVWLK